MVAKSKSKSKGNTAAAGGATGLATFDFFLPYFQYMPLPRLTAVDNFYSATLNIPAGVIRRLTVEFPKGCAGLAGIQIWRGPRQIFPLPEGVWLRSNDAILPFAFSEVVDREPFSVEFRGYNLDDTYDHTIWVGLEMSGPKAVLSPSAQAFLNLM